MTARLAGMLCTAVAIYRLILAGAVPLYDRYWWCCQVFLLSCFAVLLLLVRHTLYGVVVYSTSIYIFFETLWSYVILRSTNFLRKCFLKKLRDGDSKADPSHLDLEE